MFGLPSRSLGVLLGLVRYSVSFLNIIRNVGLPIVDRKYSADILQTFYRKSIEKNVFEIEIRKFMQNALRL